MNKKYLNKNNAGLSILLATRCSLLAILCSCAAPMPRSLNVPAAEYAARVKNDYAQSNPDYRARMHAEKPLGGRPSPLNPYGAKMQQISNSQIALVENENQMVTNLDSSSPSAINDKSFEVQDFSQQQAVRDYTGPLSLGEPGVGSSLWRENKSFDLIRDVRAFQPMDLITIMVEETTEGRREADTDVRQESTLSASISSLFGIDDSVIKSNPQVANGSSGNLEDIAGAEFTSEFIGEGETTRRGFLRGRISAMVVEVLPSGILRIEGEKIVAVNNEDEIMVISGLVRPEDINSANEVRSSKIANVRIDYFGQGTVGDAQIGGWFSRILRRMWPL